MTQADGPLAEREPGAEAAIELVELSRDAYNPDTLGYAYFPEVLEGRHRPPNVTDVKLYFGGRKTTQLLEDRGITTVEGLMRMTTAEFDELPARYKPYVDREIRIKLDSLAERQSVTPHGNLLSAVFGGARQGPVPIGDEAALARVVENALYPDLRSEEAQVLRLRFGLDDWQPKSLDQLGKIFGTGRDKIRQIESKAIVKLRHRSRSDDLRGYVTLPYTALGRQLGFVYRRDVPNVPVRIGDLGLSEPTIEAVQGSIRHREEDHDFDSLLIDTSSRTLLEAAQAELLTALQTAMRVHRASVVFGDLLDEVSVPFGKAGHGIINNTAVDVFRLSAAAQHELRSSGHVALGSLLYVERDADGQIRDFSAETANEVGGKAERLSLYLAELVKRLHP